MERLVEDLEIAEHKIPIHSPAAGHWRRWCMRRSKTTAGDDG